jgi:hypothetical protein
MADDDIDDPDTNAEGTTLVDPVAAAIALTELVDSFHRVYKLATDSKANKARLRALAKLDRQIADAENKRAAIEADATAIVTRAESDVRAIREDAEQRLEAAATAEAELAERENKIARLEAAWRGLGEPADVLSGFRSPEFSPIQKARLAVGQAPGRDPCLLFAEPDAAATVPIDALSDTSDDPHAVRQGAPFLGELTRSVAHKRKSAA